MYTGFQIIFSNTAFLVANCFHYHPLLSSKNLVSPSGLPNVGEIRIANVEGNLRTYEQCKLNKNLEKKIICNKNI